MKITQTHVNFYYQKKHGYLKKHIKQKTISIHDLINSQTKNNIDAHHIIGNVIVILKLTRKLNKPLLPQIIKMIDQPGTLSWPKKRVAFCKRLIKRYRKTNKPF